MEPTLEGMQRHVELLLSAHAHLRRDLKQLRAAMDSLITEPGSAAAARKTIGSLALTQHAWDLNAFCAAYCGLVHTHHSIEDRHLFGDLERQDPSLRPGLRELVAEHLELAELCRALEAALTALPGDAAAGENARQAGARLDAHLDAHLRREEHLIIPALAQLPA